MQKLYSESSISNIADAIRAKGGTGTFTVGEMAQAIEDLPSGGSDRSIAMADGSITEYVDDTITKLRGNALSYCYNLETVICHNVTSIGGAIFNDDRAENSITPLLSVAFPKLTEIQGYRMQNNRKLGKLDLTSCTNLAQRAFENCYWLSVLVLRRNSIVTLAQTNAFNNTPFVGRQSRTADLYVPSALVSSYESATNWSTILANGYVTIHAIEGSPYENYYVDGTPIE